MQPAYQVWLEDKCRAAFNREVGALIFVRRVRTKYAVERHADAITIRVANGQKIELAQRVEPIAVSDEHRLISAAAGCGRVVASLYDEARQRWPGKALVWAENWPLSMLWAKRPGDGVEVGVLDLRGAILPIDGLSRVPDQRAA